MHFFENGIFLFHQTCLISVSILCFQLVLFLKSTNFVWDRKALKVHCEKQHNMIGIKSNSSQPVYSVDFGVNGSRWWWHVCGMNDLCELRFVNTVHVRLRFTLDLSTEGLIADPTVNQRLQETNENHMIDHIHANTFEAQFKTVEMG